MSGPIVFVVWRTSLDEGAHLVGAYTSFDKARAIAWETGKDDQDWHRVHVDRLLLDPPDGGKEWTPGEIPMETTVYEEVLPALRRYAHVHSGYDRSLTPLFR